MTSEYFVINRTCSNPWGNFKGTWDLPDKISKQEAFLINGIAVDGQKFGKLVNCNAFIAGFKLKFFKFFF